MQEIELKLSPASDMTESSCRSMHTTVKTARIEMKVGRKMSVHTAITPTTACARGTGTRGRRAQGCGG